MVTATTIFPSSCRSVPVHPAVVAASMRITNAAATRERGLTMPLPCDPMVFLLRFGIGLNLLLCENKNVVPSPLPVLRGTAATMVVLDLPADTHHRVPKRRAYPVCEVP